MKNPSGHAAVKVRNSAICHWETGKVQNNDEPKSEDLLTIYAALPASDGGGVFYAHNFCMFA